MTGNSIEIEAMELFELACEQPSDARLAWLEAATQDNAALRERVLVLLKQDQSDDSIVATGQAIRAAYEHTESEIPTQIGNYTITRLIGEGGMGAVYEGMRNNDDFDLRVAIKVIKPGLLSDSITERFMRERQVLADFNHPGIARLFDGGQLDDGSPYFVMEYVDGTPITQYAQDNGLDVKQRLALFMQVCEATKHAHANLIVHRDITTSNVIVSTDGVVKLIDFGIAKPHSDEGHDSNADRPSIASLSFTPGFAAPERMTGAPVTILTDIFSLGCLLQALLKHSVVPAELRALIAKAIEPDPLQRLSSADVFLADIKRFLSHHPLSVIEGKFSYVTRKFLQRNKLQSVLGVALALAIISGLIASLVLANKAQTEARIAKANLAKSEYYLARSEVFFFGNNAYSDVLQRVFGSSTDIETQTRLLKDRWQEAHDSRVEDPINAAALSFAIGRHFMFRNDYKTALEIFEPWLLEGYGDPLLVNLSRPLLATVYGRLGRSEDAIPVYRQSVEWLSSGYEAGSPDHISAASNLARFTMDNQDILAADKLLVDGLNGRSGEEPQLAAYYWQQLGALRDTRGDFEGSHLAKISSLSLIKDNPLLELSGKDTVRLNLALSTFFLRKDLSVARQLATEAEEISAKKGDSLETGRTYYLQSLLLAEDGQFEDALSRIEKAIDLIARYTDSSTTLSINARTLLVEIYTQMGDVERAIIELEKLRSDMDAFSLSQSSRTRISLGQAFISLRYPEKMSLPTLTPEDYDVIKRSGGLTYWFTELEKLGLDTG